jgi:hypothetical protein
VSMSMSMSFILVKHYWIFSISWLHCVILEMGFALWIILVTC